MYSVNPLSMIQRANQIPEVLKKEMDEALFSTSLDNQVPNDQREPVLDGYIDNRLRSEKPITYLSFIDEFRRLWEAAGKKGKIVRQEPLGEEATYPTITFRVIRRVINPHFKDLKPRFRSVVEHPLMEHEYVEIYGQIFDVWLELCVYSPSAEEADELVLEVEDFLQTYAGFFKASGVQELQFFAQGEDEVLTQGRLSIAKRKLQYTIRFEKIIVRFLNEIQNIALQASLLQQEKNK